MGEWKSGEVKSPMQNQVVLRNETHEFWFSISGPRDMTAIEVNESEFLELSLVRRQAL